MEITNELLFKRKERMLNKQFSINTIQNYETDLKLFINLEKVDIKKINYKTLMRIVAIINALDVGIVLLMTNLVNSLLLKLVIAVPAIFIVLFMSYNFAGFILKKKGMTKNES